jgi:hypothetical protein
MRIVCSLVLSLADQVAAGGFSTRQRRHIRRRARESFGVADRECVGGVTAGAFGVGVHRPADIGRVPGAEMEREAGAVMTFVD